MTGWIVMIAAVTGGMILAYRQVYNSGYYDGYLAEEDSDDGQPAQGD